MFPADAAALQIRASFPALRTAQIGLENLYRGLVHLEQRFAQLRFRVVEAGALGHRDAIALGELLERLGKRQPVDLHDEVEDIAADAAAEALVELPGLIDAERG